MTDASNYGALSEGLRHYVAAMRDFIARTLREQHGDSDDWFEKQALATLPKPLRNSVQRRWLVQQRQSASDGGDGPEQLLDPSHFRHIISAYWDNTYEAIFEERVAIHWIAEIAYWRNVWVHAADKADVEAERILDTCERVVERFDPEATQRIERIRAGLTAAPTTDSAAPTDQPSLPDEATDNSPGEAKNEEAAAGVRFNLRELGLSSPMRYQPPQDEALRELVREYCQYQDLLYLGDEGLADADAATEIWVEATSRLTLALVQEVITHGTFHGVDYTTSPPTYDFSIASGIAVSIQISLPKWALQGDVC